DDDDGSDGGGEATDEGADDGSAEAGEPGGTLIWVHEQEPSDMHLDDPENNLSITSWILQSMYEGLYGVSSETTFIPELLAEEGEVVENDDGTTSINMVLRDGLTWSDGEPLTSEDVEFTYNVITEGCPAGDDGTI